MTVDIGERPSLANRHIGPSGRGESRIMVFCRDLLIVLGAYFLFWTLSGFIIFLLQFILPTYIASTARPGSGTLLSLHDLFPLPLVALGAGATLRAVLYPRGAVGWALVLGCLLGLSCVTKFASAGEDSIEREMRTGSYVAGGLTAAAAVLGAGLGGRKKLRGDIES